MCTGLTLRHVAPRRPAWYGESSALTITPSCPASSAVRANASAAVGVDGVERRQQQARRAPARRATALRSCSGRSISDAPPAWSTSKKNGCRLRADAHRVLELERVAVDVEAERLAVEHDVVDRQRADGVDDLGQPRPPTSCRRAGEHAHVVADAVDLDARPVELPLHARRAGERQRIGRRTRRSRRASAARRRAGSGRRRGRRRPGPASAAAPRSPSSIAARRTSASGRPAALATASVSTPSLAPWRSSPMITRTRWSCSSAVAAPSSASSAAARSRCEPAPLAAASRENAASTSPIVRVGSAAGAGRVLASCRPADAEASLARRADEQADRGDDLVGRQRAQQPGERLHLRRPLRRRRHRLRCRHEIGQQGHPRQRATTTGAARSGVQIRGGRPRPRLPAGGRRERRGID